MSPVQHLLQVSLRIGETWNVDEMLRSVADGIRRARLSGFVVRPRPGVSLPIGIRINNSDIEIWNVEVSGASEAGVWIGGISRSTLTGSYIHSNQGSGIVVAGASTPQVFGNIIQLNGAGSRPPLLGIVPDSRWGALGRLPRGPPSGRAASPRTGHTVRRRAENCKASYRQWPALSQPPVFASRQSSIENCTSAEVKPVPSCHFAGRRLNVQVRLSSETAHFSARSSTILV